MCPSICNTFACKGNKTVVNRIYGCIIKNKCTRDLKTDQENLSSQAIQIESNGLKICSKLTVRTQPGGFDMVWMCCVVVGIRIHRCEALR